MAVATRKYMRRILGLAAAGLCALTLGSWAQPVSAKAVSPVNIEAKEYDLTLNQTRQGVFPRGVSYEGISLEGMTVADAKAQIAEYAAERASRYIRLVFGENSFYEYNASSFGIGWTNPEVCDQLDAQTMSGNFIEQYKKQKDLDENPVDLDLQFSLDTGLLRTTLEEYVQAFTAEPRNATIHRGEGGAFVVEESVTGRSYDTEAIYNDLVAKLTDFSTAESLIYEVPCTVTPAQYDSSYFQFSSTPLGSYTTSDLGDDNRRTNIIISANNMNGHVFYPGEQISTLALYDDIIEENGYQLAGAYEEGRQIESIGGGICQTTTTLYNAVLRAELQVDSRRGHSMVVTYVPPAMDATVYYRDHLDFLFTNNTGYPIYIESWVDGDNVSVNIWGVETRSPSRRIAFDSQVRSIQWPEPLFVQNIDDVNNIVGSAEAADKSYVEVLPHPLLRATSYKIVYENDVEVSREVLNDNTYKAMSGILYHASDCRVNDSVGGSDKPDAVYANFGWDVYVPVVTLAGGDWPSPASIRNSIEVASREAESRSLEEASRQAEEAWLQQQAAQQAEWEAQQPAPDPAEQPAP